MKLPKRLKTDITAEIGVNIVSTIFNDQFGWVFRRTHQEHDFGVDGYIDYVTPTGDVTGQFIAVQIKTGKSYLSNKGSHYWYKDTKEHLNYFLNLPTPVLLIICDPEKGICYWGKLDKNIIDFSDNGWKQPIPKEQILNVNHLGEITNLFGIIEDHVSEFEQDQSFLQSIEEDSFIQYSIPKDDIKKGNVKNLKSFLERITRNEKLTLAVQGKLYIASYGYENDTREVHQIKEIRKWAEKARKEIIVWYLCATNESRLSTLIWIAACTSGVKSNLEVAPDGRKVWEVENDIVKLIEFVQECFHGLNEASEKWGWSEKYNYEISKKIHQELVPTVPFPSLKNKA